MQITNILILVAFLILVTAMVIQYGRLRFSDSTLLGNPSIVKIHFYTGKIALFAPWLFFVAKALEPSLGYIDSPDILVWISVILLYVAVPGFVLGLFDIGASLRIGLPEKTISLKTKGMFRFSRNPLYLCSFIIAFASCLFFPDLINISCTVYGIVIHHLIVLKEEKYLKNLFGQEYEGYREKVRRYL
jgi:protein-S-isoprenylcysteine O-methyltransferase Ste14